MAAQVASNDLELRSGTIIDDRMVRTTATAVGASLTLQPWRSVVLVAASAVSPSPPYHAASGIDWRAGTPVTSYLGDDSSIFADGFESGDLLAWVTPTQ